MTAQYKVGPVDDGTISGTTGTDDITGSGSDFSEQAAAGDTLVIINDVGVHVPYTIKTVTDDTHIILTGNLSDTYTTCAYYTLRAANALTTPGYYPKSNYSLGDPVRTGSGALLYRGYARSAWEYARMSITELKNLRTYLLSGAQSGQCYVLTRDMDDTWDTYRAIVDFPDPQGLSRWAEGYNQVALLFHLVVAV